MAVNDYITFESAIIIVILLAVLGFFVPTAFTAQQTPKTTSFDHQIDSTVTLTTYLDATIDGIDDNVGTINVTVLDTKSGETSATGPITEGSSQTVSVDGESVTVTNQEILSSSRAIVTYEYPTFYGWPSGAKELVQLLVGLTFVIVAAFIWFLVSLQEKR